MAKIVNTDNFGGDYPNEKFVENLPPMTEAQAQFVVAAINQVAHHGYGEIGGPRNFKVVPDDYQLQPGFAP